jgi:hypothetical protein
MDGLLRRAAGALALAILAGGYAHAPALAQDERPDLKIEVVGLDPNDPRTVRIVVTNVGEWWADHTTATVETVAPAPGNRLQEDVLDLDPKQQPQGPTDYKYPFTYTLAAACGGQPVTVRATLSAAKTFNGNAETNLADNRHELQVCGGGGAIGVGDVNSGGNAGNAIGVGDIYGGPVTVEGVDSSRPRIVVHPSAP